jgi:hypothetical protein
MITYCATAKDNEITLGDAWLTRAILCQITLRRK